MTLLRIKERFLDPWCDDFVYDDWFRLVVFFVGEGVFFDFAFEKVIYPGLIDDDNRHKIFF